MQYHDAENRTNITTLSRWLHQALRSSVLLPPRLEGLCIGPPGLLLLTLAVLAGGVLVQRVFIPGPAQFYWQGLGGGWLATVVLLWACWLAARSAPSAGEQVPTLFAVLVVQQALITWPAWGMYLLVQRAQGLPEAVSAVWGYAPWAVLGWAALAGAVLLARHAARGAVRAVVVLAFAAATAATVYLPRGTVWYPDVSAADAGTESTRLHLTQEAMEQQSAVVVSTLDALQPQRPGTTDVYVITFAPYAGEDVFRRESTVVSDLMRTRFDAQGRTVSLLNHADTVTELPWATGLNLHRAIDRAAQLMDRDEDVLFIHLTSHGAKNGQLSADFDPLEVDMLTPEKLRAWLDEAGVRWRVISVSACYSGSWLPLLAGPGTLVMTAADAQHTSYGCGRGSELTFFGRAMYAEQLRQTRSFEVAHAAARTVIAQREREAGKKDGYSNPQLVMGEAIRPRLAALAARLDAAPQ